MPRDNSHRLNYRYRFSQPRRTQILNRYTSTNPGNILKLVWKRPGTYKACKSPDTSFLALLLVQPTSEQIVVSAGIHAGHGKQLWKPLRYVLSFVII